MALTLSPADRQAIASRVGYSTTEVLVTTDPAYILLDLNEDNVILAMEDLLQWRASTDPDGSEAWPALFKEAVLDKLASMIAVSLQQRVELADYFEKRAMEAIALLRGQDDWMDTAMLRTQMATAEIEAWNYSFALQDTVAVVAVDTPNAPEYLAQIALCDGVLQVVGIYQEKRELRFDRVGPACKLYDYRDDGGDVIVRGTWLPPEDNWPTKFTNLVDLRVIAYKAAIFERDTERATALQAQGDKVAEELRRIDLVQAGKDIELIGRAEMECYPWKWNRKSLEAELIEITPPSVTFSGAVLLTRDMLRIEMVRYDGTELRYERSGRELFIYDSVPIGEFVEIVGQWYYPPTEWPEMFRRAVEHRAQGERLLASNGSAAAAERYFASAKTCMAQAMSADSQQQTAVRIEARGLARARKNASTTWTR